MSEPSLSADGKLCQPSHRRGIRLSPSRKNHQTNRSVTKCNTERTLGHLGHRLSFGEDLRIPDEEGSFADPRLLPQARQQPGLGDGCSKAKTNKIIS